MILGVAVYRGDLIACGGMDISELRSSENPFVYERKLKYAPLLEALAAENQVTKWFCIKTCETAEKARNMVRSFRKGQIAVPLGIWDFASVDRDVWVRWAGPSDKVEMLPAPRGRRINVPG